MSYQPAPAAYPPPPGSGSPGNVRLRGRVPRILGWILLGVAAIAFVVGGVVLGTKSFGKVNGFERVPYPNGGTVSLDGTGKWVVYLEAGNVDSLDRIPFGVFVTGPSGQKIRSDYYGNPGSGSSVDRFTYDYNGHHGIAAYQFNAPVAGRYRIVGVATEQTVGPGADLAVGRDITNSTLAGAVLIIIGIPTLIAAIVLLIVGYVKRSRHKRELQSGQFWGAPAPAWGAPSAGYAPQGYPPPAPPPGYAPPPPPGYGSPPQQPGFGSPPQQPGFGNPPQQPGFGNPPEQPGYGEPQPPSGGDSEQR